MLYQICCPALCPIEHHLATTQLTKMPAVGDLIHVQPDDWTVVGMLNMGFQIGAHQASTGPVMVEAIEEPLFEDDLTVLRVQAADESVVVMTDFYAELATRQLPEAVLTLVQCSCGGHVHSMPEQAPNCVYCDAALRVPELPNWHRLCPNCRTSYWWSEGAIWGDPLSLYDCAVKEWAAWSRQPARVVRNQEEREKLFEAFLMTDRMRLEGGWVFIRPEAS